MSRSNLVPIVATVLVVVALLSVGLLRRGMGEPVTESQVSAAPGAYYRTDLEALYLHEVRVAGDPALAATADDELLARGRGICSALDSGAAAPEGTAAELGVAVTALCPEHAGAASS
jgi:hypothetical protein